MAQDEGVRNKAKSSMKDMGSSLKDNKKLINKAVGAVVTGDTDGLKDAAMGVAGDMAGAAIGDKLDGVVDDALGNVMGGMGGAAAGPLKDAAKGILGGKADDLKKQAFKAATGKK